MPRYPKFDPSIDECLTINISYLHKWKHLRPNTNVSGASYIWKQNGSQIASIAYSIECINPHLKRITLEYKHKEVLVNYSIDIEGITTNLGNGQRWYFICPYTAKRCMKLISPTGCKYFYHRTAFKLLYDSQKKSKEYRNLEATYGWMFKEERLQEELYQKYRKTHYRGQPTPLMKKIIKLEKSLPVKKKLMEEFTKSLKS